MPFEPRSMSEREGVTVLIGLIVGLLLGSALGKAFDLAAVVGLSAGVFVGLSLSTLVIVGWNKRDARRRK